MPIYQYKTLRVPVRRMTKEPVLNNLGEQGFLMVGSRSIYPDAYGPDDACIPEQTEFIFAKEVRELFENPRPIHIYT